MQNELAPLLVVLVQIQIATQGFRKSFAHIEADAVGALVHSAAVLVRGLKEHLEEVLFVLLRDSDSLICHFEVDSDKAGSINNVLLHTYEHFRVVFTELHCVLNEIDQYLLAAHFVKLYNQVLFFFETFHSYLHSLTFCI